MDLKECRERLDGIDEKLLELYEERMAVCEMVAAAKMKTGRQVLDKEREEQKLSAIEALVRDEKNRSGARELFRLLMSLSRDRQAEIMNTEA